MGEHTSRPACAVFIGIGRFRILGGGQGLEYWGANVHVHICFYKTGIKPADCQILFYHTTRGLEWKTVLCMIIAPSEGF